MVVASFRLPVDVAYDHDHDPNIDGFAVAACNDDLGKGNPTAPHGWQLAIDRQTGIAHTVQTQHRKAADVDLWPER
ncbi:hypothetical protein PG985_002847 [Apiospora marii]|uniref:Uncharacterized protein n=1 Tax=Apiospora marii TaxID=335849 RepID=A0ABR1RVZ3_9PEZI